MVAKVLCQHPVIKKVSFTGKLGDAYADRGLSLKAAPVLESNSQLYAPAH